ncbi:MAG: helix-turn-helix transcriptional regulator [bacterium]
MTSVALPHQALGTLLRGWRQRRHLSQLALALEADISQRHLSFIESGRARPKREMVLHIAQHLDVPLRERNHLLLAAGYAPVFPERTLDDPALDAVRGAVDMVLKGHEPYPALAIDRHWRLLAANAAVPQLLIGVDASLLEAPVNVLRLSLHPQGLAPRIVNFAEWRGHVLDRVRRQVDASADIVLIQLLRELSDYPVPARQPTSSAVATRSRSVRPHTAAGVFVPLQLETDAGVLSFLSTTTVFGTPADITVSELALECFYPADAATAELLRSAR